MKLLAAGATLGLLLSCAAVRAFRQVDPKVQEQRAAVAQRLQAARAANARRCAPEDLAVAEANDEFARIELTNGTVPRASQHLVLALQAADRAILASKKCPAAPSRQANPDVHPPADLKRVGGGCTVSP